MSPMIFLWLVIVSFIFFIAFHGANVLSPSFQCSGVDDQTQDLIHANKVLYIELHTQANFLFYNLFPCGFNHGSYLFSICIFFFFGLMNIHVVNYLAMCRTMSIHLFKLCLVGTAIVLLDTFIYKFCVFESLYCLWTFLPRNRKFLYVMVIWGSHKVPCFSNAWLKKEI